MLNYWYVKLLGSFLVPTLSLSIFGRIELLHFTGWLYSYLHYQYVVVTSITH